MFRAKICGHRSLRDLEVSIGAGADAVGLISGVRHRSEDALPADGARALLARVPVFVTSVLVTHLRTAADVLALHRAVPAQVVQLHDQISDVEVETLRRNLPGVPLLRAVHVVDDASLLRAVDVARLADAVLLDSRTEDRIGGTGRTHDWSLSRRIVEALDVPVVLAGGLTPDNLSEALGIVRPYAVDVNSGVDDSAGDKDPDRVTRFVTQAHRARTTPSAAPVARA